MKTTYYLLLSLLLISSYGWAGKTATITKTNTAPVIDGTIDGVWKSTVAHKMDSLVVNVGDLTPTVAATWRGLWDANNLYLLFEVEDDVVTNNGTGNSVWYMHDCIEVFTDMKNLKSDAAVTNSEGEYQLRFIYGLDDELIHENPTMVTYKSVSVKTGNGYLIEVKFPWSYLIANTSVAIAEGLKIGMDFKVTDIDGPTTGWWPPHIEYAWNAATDKKPKNFGELELVQSSDNEKPSAPSNLTHSLTGINLTLNWAASTDNVAVTGYTVKNGTQILAGVAGNVTTATVNLDYGTTYNVTVTALDAAGNESNASNVVTFTTEGLPPLPAGTPIAKASGPVTIDGIADETDWNTASYLIPRVDTWAPNVDVTGHDDFSASFKGLWDDENLYLVFNVNDDNVHQGVGNADNLWIQDCIEVIIPKNATENYKYRFVHGKDNESVRSGTEIDVPVGFKNVSTLTDTGYMIEVSIPWSTIPDAADGVERGSTFRVSFSALDIDRADASLWTHISGILGWPYTNVSNIIALGYASDVTIETQAPAAPTGLTATPKDFKSIDLSWTASPNALLYTIIVNGKIVASTGNTVFTVDKLEPETSYEIQVIANTAQKYSVASQKVTATTPKQPEPLIRRVGIAKTNVDPSIDYEVWDEIVGAEIFHPERTFDPADFSANWKALWDDNNLYFQIHVYDDYIYTGSADGWRNDNIELHFDMNNESDGTSCETVDDNWQIDNFQYRFIAYDKVKQTGSGNAPVWTGVDVNYFDLQEGGKHVGYLTEIAIPWTSLTTEKSDQITFVPSLGSEFAFEIKVTDKDPFVNDAGVTVYDNAQANGEMCWNLQDYSFSPNRNNSQYGKIYLALEQNTPVFEVETYSDLTVYPNPARDVLHVEVQSSAAKTITLTDITGKVVMTRTIENTNGVEIISVSGLSSGIYLLTATGPASISRAKIMVK